MQTNWYVISISFYSNKDTLIVSRHLFSSLGLYCVCGWQIELARHHNTPFAGFRFIFMTGNQVHY